MDDVQPTKQTAEPESKTADDSAAERPTESIKRKRTARRHSHKLLYTILAVLGIVLLIPVLVAGWFGFVPGLSNIMGARTAKDLGVTWTQADLASYKQKTGTTFLDFANAPVNPVDPAKKTIFADPKTVESLQVSQSEITAAINSLNWELLPATNVQVRLTTGTVEVSGNLKLDRAADFIRFIGGVGYSNDDVNKALDWGKSFVNGTAFYAKGSSSVTDNTLSLNLEQIQIGRFGPPIDISSNVIHTGGSNGIQNTKNLDVISATVGNGELTFTGTYPTTIYVKH